MASTQDRAIRNGIWDCNYAYPNWHLKGNTLGLIGFGHIAQAVARKMSGFDLNLMAYDPLVSQQKMQTLKVRHGTLQEVLSQSDFISLHLPLTKETHHLISERELHWMKPKAVLINTSRGPIIDEKALIKALAEGWIGAAGLDVFETEPLSGEHPFTKLSNIVLSPHNASCSDQKDHDFWYYSVQTIIDLSRHCWPRSYVNRNVTPRWNLVKVNK